ncbi:PHP domain-containing protein [Chlamydiales bacterium]|nr:PHP domain-containing protein [Chlamydiales bacterium]
MKYELSPMFKADLHTHSYFSDGSFSPEELVDLAVKNSLNGLSITDHDTTDAYSRLIPYAKEKNLPLISGIEISSSYKGVPIHILGYGFKLSHPSIISIEEMQKKRRFVRNQGLIERLNKKGIDLTQEEVLSLFPHPPSQLGRPHIAKALLNRGVISSIQEAFSRYIGEGKSCYIPSITPTIEEVIDHIHQAGGLAILAHPHLIRANHLITNILDHPFDGLEGYYGTLSPKKDQKWVNIASSKGWTITGGSDFHGDTKPNQPIASSWTNMTTFTLLEEKFNENLS